MVPLIVFTVLLLGLPARDLATDARFLGVPSAPGDLPMGTTPRPNAIVPTPPMSPFVPPTPAIPDAHTFLRHLVHSEDLGPEWRDIVGGTYFCDPREHVATYSTGFWRGASAVGPHTVLFTAILGGRRETREFEGGPATDTILQSIVEVEGPRIGDGSTWYTIAFRWEGSSSVLAVSFDMHQVVFDLGGVRVNLAMAAEPGNVGQEDLLPLALTADSRLRQYYAQNLVPSPDPALCP